MSHFVQNYPMWIILAIGGVAAYLQLIGVSSRVATAVGLGLLIALAATSAFAGAFAS